MALPSTTALPHVSTNKDFGTVFFDFFNEKKKDLTKLIGYTSFWIGEAIGKSHPQHELTGRVSGFCGDAKNLMSTMEIPEKVSNVRKAFDQFVAEPGIETGRKLVLKEFTGLVNPVCDAIDISSKFVPVAAETMKQVKAANFTATLIGSTNGAVEQVQKMQATDVTTEKTVLYMINLARDVSYVALAVIGLSSMFLGFAAAPWMFLACLTSGLVFGIGGYFYERIVNPEGKHPDMNKVRDNLLAENTQLRANAAPTV